MDMCESMQLELAHEMTQTAWSELRELTDGAEAAFDLPGYAKSVLRDMLAESTSHPPEHYNNEANMLMRMKDAVQAKNALAICLTDGSACRWRRPTCCRPRTST